MTRIALPRLLDPATGGRRHIDVEASTLDEALDGLAGTMPGVMVHLFDERGRLRPHVLCFVDGERTRLEDRTRSAGEEIRFLQAVSGGAAQARV